MILRRSAVTDISPVPRESATTRQEAPHEPAEVTVGLSPRVNLNQHLNLVAVDFIGRDGAE
jgi:hypothetical protein